MNLLLYVDLKNRKFVSSLTDSAEVSTLNFRQGDTVRMCIQPVEEIGSDAASEVLYRVVPFRLDSEYSRVAVGVGYIDRAPTGGTFKVRVNNGAATPVIQTTGALAYNATKKVIETAINGLSEVTALGGITVTGATTPPTPEVGAKHIHQISWNTPESVPAAADIYLYEDKLSPRSFFRSTQFTSHERGTVHVLRIFQAPMAFQDAFQNLVPTTPIVGLVRAGTGNRNEIQSISFDTDSKSTYSFSFAGFTTPPLPDNSTSVVVQDALNALYTDGVQRFKVTNMRRGAHYVEFIGFLGNIDHQAPGGLGMLIANREENVLSQFAYAELDMGSPAIELALDGAASIAVKFELEIRSISPSTSGANVVDTPIIIDATIENDMLDEDIALYHDPDYLASIHNPVGWVDYGEGTVATGTVHFVAPVGDLVATEYVVEHLLNTQDIFIQVRENATGAIVPDDQYLCEFLNDGEFKITFSHVPEVGQYIVMASTAEVTTLWAPHTHKISQIVGETPESPTLRDELDALLGGTSPLELWPEIPVDKIPLEELIAAIAANPDGVLTTLTEAIITNIQTDSGSLATFVEMFTTVLEGEPTLVDAIGESLADSEKFAETLKTIFTTNEEVTNTVVKSLIQDPDFRAAVASAFQLGTAVSTSVIPITIPTFSDEIEGYLGYAVNITSTPPIELVDYTGTLPRASDANKHYRATIDGKAYAGPERKKTFPDNALVYSTGRDWFEARPSGATLGYPKEYEKELFTISVTPEMLVPGSQFALSFSVTLQLLANCEGMCQLLFRRGTVTEVDSDMQTIVWDGTEIMKFNLHITDSAVTHAFGYQVTRPLTGPITAKKIVYTKETPLGDPTMPQMILRAELVNFDMEGGVLDPKGKLIRSMTAAVASIVKL